MFFAFLFGFRQISLKRKEIFFLKLEFSPTCIGKTSNQGGKYRLFFVAMETMFLMNSPVKTIKIPKIIIFHVKLIFFYSFE